MGVGQTIEVHAKDWKVWKRPTTEPPTFLSTAFQDYLRTQSSNTTSVNLIISTVDYLLRLQESIMDFYWHFSNKPVIDESGRTNFIKAIKIGKQLFRTLTEYIQVSDMSLSCVFPGKATDNTTSSL